jgi:hypothetical protein
MLSAVGESRIDLDGQHAHPTYKDTELLTVNPVPFVPGILSVDHLHRQAESS